MATLERRRQLVGEPRVERLRVLALVAEQPPQGAARATPVGRAADVPVTLALPPVAVRRASTIASTFATSVAAATPTGRESARLTTERSPTGGRARARSSTASPSAAVRSQVNVRARRSAAAPMRSRRSPSVTSSRTRSVSCAGSSASAPGLAVDDRLRQPADAQRRTGRRARGGLHGVRHQPSADEAVSDTHADAYSSRLRSSDTKPWRVTRSTTRGRRSRPRAPAGGHPRRRCRDGCRECRRARRAGSRGACPRLIRPR